MSVLKKRPVATPGNVYPFKHVYCLCHWAHYQAYVRETLDIIKKGNRTVSSSSYFSSSLVQFTFVPHNYTLLTQIGRR